VAHDQRKPFIVKTADAKTQVLGTTFNVKARTNRDVEITLVEGSVEVSAGERKAMLKPGEQAQVNLQSHVVTTRAVSTEQFVGWKDNILFFEETSLADAVTVLESWYDVDIVISSESLKGCEITARYQNESLENVLKSIQFLLGANVTKTKNSLITISGNRCK
jgi:transmembrane sensor